MSKTSKSSKRWLGEHFADIYVKRAQKEGYRSRAVYKLLEVHRKDGLFKSGMVVVDLGAAPGGWSQVARKLLGPEGTVIATDILPMEAIPGVNFIQGDFTREEVLEQLLFQLSGQQVDLVICDMAPNISGVKVIDQPRAILLVELALDFAKRVLKPDGKLLVKVFQGEGFEILVKEMRQHFRNVKTCKPQASRGRSREVYLLGKGFHI